MDERENRAQGRLERLAIALWLFGLGACVAMILGQFDACLGIGAGAASIFVVADLINRFGQKQPPDAP